MLKRQKKTSKRKSVKRKNPESYNLVFSDREIEKLTPKQAIQHILVVSEYPSSRKPYWSNDEDTFAGMDAKEILEYIHDFTNKYEYMHYDK